MTAAHNGERAITGGGLPPVAWDATLASIAQAHADYLATICDIEHSGPGDAGYPYGENLYITATSSSAGPRSVPGDPVDSWVGEKTCYGYGGYDTSDSCSGSCQSGCGHYTQIVWGDTERIGCGVSTCFGAFGGAYYADIWVCNYDPPGNYIGETPY